MKKLLIPSFLMGIVGISLCAQAEPTETKSQTTPTEFPSKISSPKSRETPNGVRASLPSTPLQKPTLIQPSLSTKTQTTPPQETTTIDLDPSLEPFDTGISTTVDLTEQTVNPPGLVDDITRFLEKYGVQNETISSDDFILMPSDEGESPVGGPIDLQPIDLGHWMNPHSGSIAPLTSTTKKGQSNFYILDIPSIYRERP